MSSKRCAVRELAAYRLPLTAHAFWGGVGVGTVEVLFQCMDRNSIDWERLDRYVTGRGTAEELAALEAWVSSDAELRAIAAAMRTAGRPPGIEQRPWDVRGAWQRLRRRMDRAPLRILSSADRAYSPPRSPIAIGERRRARWLVGTAAAALVIAPAS